MSAGSQPATLARAGARGSEVVGTSASWKVCPRAGAGLELEEGALSSEPEWATDQNLVQVNSTMVHPDSPQK